MGVVAKVSKDPKTKLLTLPTWMVSQATKKCLAIIAEKNANHGENYHEILKKSEETPSLQKRNPHVLGTFECQKSTPGACIAPRRHQKYTSFVATAKETMHLWYVADLTPLQYVWNTSDELNLSPHSKAL